MGVLVAANILPVPDGHVSVSDLPLFWQHADTTLMQPAIRSRQHLSLDDFDYGYFDYDKPRRRVADDHLSGLHTPDTFTVLPPLPPPTPSPPPAPRAYRFTSPTRRQRKASFVILTGPQPLLPGSASSTRIPSPVENKKPNKSRIPRSQPVSREPSPARKKSLNQPRSSVSRKTSVNGNKDASPSNNNKPPLSRKSSVRGSKSAPQSPIRKNSRPQVPRKTSVPGKKDVPQDPIRKNSKQQDAQSSPSRIPRPSQSSAGKKKLNHLGKSLSSTGNKQTVFRKNSNLKPLAGKPPIPPNKTVAGTSKTVQKSSEQTKNAAPTDKPTSKSDVEVPKTETTKKVVELSKTESEPKPIAEPSEDSIITKDSCVYVNPTMASAPATTSAPATSTPADQVATSTTSATPAPATSTSTTAPQPSDTRTTLVSATTHPALELAEPTQVETSEAAKSSSAGSKVSADPKSVHTESMESVKSEDSSVTVRAASSPHPKKKGVGDEVATSEDFIKGEPDLESLSPNTPLPSDSKEVSRQPGAPSSSAEATPTPQSGGRALLSRLCPCCRNLAVPKIAAMIDSKTKTPSQPAGKCIWLKKCLCCGCCRKKEDPDAGRRKSIAASQFSKKQSRSSSTAVEKFNNALDLESVSVNNYLNNFQGITTVDLLSQTPDTRPKLDPTLLEQGSMMRGAIPVLPIPLAWICLIFNVIVPGLGTVTSGLFCLCFGKPRFQPRDDPQGRCGAFIVNLIVGASQLFTVIFCLVGWGWSIWWGLIMLRIAKKYKKLKLAEAANQQDNPVAPAIQQNHDVERGHPA